MFLLYLNITSNCTSYIWDEYKGQFIYLNGYFAPNFAPMTRLLNLILYPQKILKNLKYQKKFNCYLAASRSTLGHYRGDRLTQPMLITTFERFRPEGHRESRKGVGSLSQADRLVGFELGTFRF